MVEQFVLHEGSAKGVVVSLRIVTLRCAKLLSKAA